MLRRPAEFDWLETVAVTLVTPPVNLGQLWRFTPAWHAGQLFEIVGVETKHGSPHSFFEIKFLDGTRSGKWTEKLIREQATFQADLVAMGNRAADKFLKEWMEKWPV
jgi:hypothetical protein